MKRQLFILSLLAIPIQMYAQKKKSSPEEKKALFNKVKNKRFEWAFGGKVHTKNFKLDRSGKIKGYDHPNEKSWAVNDYGQIVIYNAGNKIQWIFTRQEDKDGQLYFVEPGGRHLLEM